MTRHRQDPANGHTAMAFSSAGLDLQTYDALLSAAGTAALPERLFDAIDRIVPVREIYGFELAPGAAPAPIVSLGRGAGAAARVDAYSRRYYPGDPLGAAIPNTATSATRCRASATRSASSWNAGRAGSCSACFGRGRAPN
jgi:hypothetical protein